MGFNPLDGFTPPKAKAQPAKRKKAPTAPATNRAITRAVRSVGKTTKAAAPAVTRPVVREVRRANRPVQGPPVPRNVADRNRSNAELAKFNAQLIAEATAAKGEREKDGPKAAGVAGLSPLLNRPNDPDNIFQRLGTGAARDVLGFGLSVPQQAQLVAMNAAVFNPAGIALRAAGSRVPGLGWMNDLEEETVRADKAAAVGLATHYNTKYIDPIRRGDWGQLADNAIDSPIGTALDAMLVKGAVGRSPAALNKAQIRMSPNSARSARLRVKQSTQPAEARRWAADVENQRRAAKGKPPLPFVEGEGKLYRPPIERRSVIADPDPGRAPVAELVTRQERPGGYSPDFITRGRQKAVDKLRPVVAEKVRGVADRLRPAPLDRPGTAKGGAAASTAPLRTEAKVAKVVRSQSLDLSNQRQTMAESLGVRNLVGDKKVDVGLDRALARLKKDTGAAGIPVRQKVSTEQMAVTMHWEGVRSPRARDIAVRRYEGEIQKYRNAGRYDDARARQAQVEIIKRIPDELLTLDDMGNPAVKRVYDAVEEGRRVGKANQEMNVKAGVVDQATADAMTTRSSSIVVGGSRWWKDAVRDVSRDYNPKIRGIRKREATVRAEARAARESGDITKAGRLYAEARRLDAQAKERVAAKRAKIEKIKKGATTETPELTKARAAFTESNTRLSEAKQTGSANEIAKAALERKSYMNRLRKQEIDHLGFTKPRRPELVTEGVYRTARNVRKSERQTGAQKQAFGPEKAKRDEGRLRQSMGYDAHPNLMIHQTARAADNYVGKASNQALRELVDTIAYRKPGTKGPDGRELLLTGDRRAMEAAAATGRVGFIHTRYLRRAINALDNLPPGQKLPKNLVDDALSDVLPPGAKASDYIAVHADGLRVWRDTMYEPNKLTRYFDNSLTLWKGGLLALMPRWYINNTVGLALQYGLLSGFDIAAVVQGNSPKVRAAMEKRSPWAVKDTFGRDNPGSTPDFMQTLFRTNSRLEEVWRRAAYMNRSKKLLKTEGVRTGKLTDVEMARALETMPESMVRSIVRDVDYFIGNYTKFSPIERRVVKRIIPFYSWLRVISKLTFGLPFRSPTRAAAMAVLSKAAIAGLDPQFYELPWYMRSAIIKGDTRIVANSANPGSTMAGGIAALGSENVLGSLLGEGLSWTHPLVGFIRGQADGATGFGDRVRGAPGSAPFGQDPSHFNPVTGTVERQPAFIPSSDAILATALPAQVAFVKKALAPQGMVPYDTTTTKQVVDDWAARMAGGKGNDKLYREVSKGGGLTPRTGRAWRIFGGATGLNVYKMDKAAITREYKQRLRDQVNEARDRERALGL